mgnify:CR=1 FL=1
MSLSWLDRLTLRVGPHTVALERKPWRGQAERYSTAVPPATVGQAAWQAALDAASALLTRHAPARSSLRIIVANPFVRYALLPWSEDILGNKARLTLANALLRNSLGEQAAQFEIALDRPAFGMNGLAAGIHRGLLEGLRMVAKAGRLRLGSIQPRLIHDLETCRASLNEGCVAFPDDGWLTLIGLQAGNLRLLRNHRTDSAPDQPGSELLGMLASESAVIDTKILRVFSARPWPATLGEWRIELQKPLTENLSHA